MLVVGVGERVDEEKLVEIAGMKKNVFMAPSYRHLIGVELIDRVTTAMCYTGKIPIFESTTNNIRTYSKFALNKFEINLLSQNITLKRT